MKKKRLLEITIIFIILALVALGIFAMWLYTNPDVNIGDILPEEPTVSGSDATEQQSNQSYFDSNYAEEMAEFDYEKVYDEVHEIQYEEPTLDTSSAIPPYQQMLVTMDKKLYSTLEPVMEEFMSQQNWDRDLWVEGSVVMSDNMLEVTYTSELSTEFHSYKFIASIEEDVPEGSARIQILKHIFVPEV